MRAWLYGVITVTCVTCIGLCAFVRLCVRKLWWLLGDFMQISLTFKWEHTQPGKREEVCKKKVIVFVWKIRCKHWGWWSTGAVLQVMLAGHKTTCLDTIEVQQFIQRAYSVLLSYFNTHTHTTVIKIQQDSHPPTGSRGSPGEHSHKISRHPRVSVSSSLFSFLTSPLDPQTPFTSLSSYIK